MGERKTGHEFLAASHGFRVVGGTIEGERADEGIFGKILLDVARAHLAGCLLVGGIAEDVILKEKLA